MHVRKSTILVVSWFINISILRKKKSENYSHNQYQFQPYVHDAKWCYVVQDSPLNYEFLVRSKNEPWKFLRGRFHV